MDNKRFFDIDIHLRFLAPIKSLCIVNVIRICFVSIFRRNFFKFSIFVSSDKKEAFCNFYNLIVGDVSHNGMRNAITLPVQGVNLLSIFT